MATKRAMATSNSGSLLALLAYPVLIESRLGVRAQGRAWTGGYACLIVMVLWGAIVVWSDDRDRTRRRLELGLEVQAHDFFKTGAAAATALMMP